MAYLDDEKSVHDAEPVELYEFIGSATTYRMVANHDDYSFDTGAGAQTFARTEVRRTNIASNGSLSPVQVEVEMPAAEALIQAYGFGVPPRDLTLKIWRVHPATGNSDKIYEGKVTAISASGRHAKLLIPSLLTSVLEITVPRIHYQANCNHRFGDSRCAVPLAQHTLSTTVASIASDNVTIGIADPMPGLPGWGKGGELVRVSDGERRQIIANNGTQALEIRWPFPALSVSDSVQVVRGCDHSLTTCHTEFQNSDRFGGHPHIPTRNVFRHGLKVGS